MNNLTFKKLLFKTAFSCMACDGHIDQREVDLVKQINSEENLVAEESVQDELNQLVGEVNSLGSDFLKLFIKELSMAELSEEEEISILKTAVRTINADENVEYSEISFFKIVRSKLSVADDSILNAIPGIEEYLEKDVLSKNYSVDSTSNFFATASLPKFDLIQSL